MAKRIKQPEKVLQSPSRRRFLRDSLLTGAAVCSGCSLTLDFDELTKGSQLGQTGFWAIQLQNIDWKRLAESRYDLVVVDNQRTVKGMEDYDMRKQVEELKKSKGRNGKPKTAISYVCIGEASDFRHYWNPDWTPETGDGTLDPKPRTQDLLLVPDPAGWPGSFAVRYWKKEWKDITFAYLDMIINDGFDGIFMDWVEAYSIESVKNAALGEGKDPKAEMAAFVTEIANHVKSKKPGFSVMALNGADLIDVEGYFGFIDAVVQEGVLFAGDYTASIMGDIPASQETTLQCFNNLSRFSEKGKPVFTIDYAEKPENAAAAYEFALFHGFKPYVTTLLLDGLTNTPPPGY